MIQCAGCGSNLVYDIARKKMYCKACGNEYEPESVDKDEDSEEPVSYTHLTLPTN